jgi:hypothetical protein
MGEVQTATIQTDVPIGLLSEMQRLVAAGWFRDLDALMLDGLRAASHHPPALKGGAGVFVKEVRHV